MGDRGHEKSIEPREAWGSSLSQLHIIEAASRVFLLVEGRACLLLSEILCKSAF